ncbi:MAG: FHA domain-containing protein [Planctomycetota bacterium]|nr:MAG: FHA domain-containing protein [Planctomycetota bacterium]
MRAKLVIRRGERPVRRCLLHSGQVFEVGRGRGVDLQLRGESISRRHALLEVRGDGVRVTDLGSRNGTYLDDRLLEAHTEAVLAPGSELRIGAFRLAAEILPGLEGASGAERAQVQRLVAGDGTEIRYQIGKGATGSVWAGWQPRLNRMVAVKVLEAVDAEDRQRFLREARLAARIESPYVVRLHDFRVERGRPYLVMELVPGLSALERLAEGEVSLGEALGIGRDLAAALVALGETGIVHRDVKPGNVLLDPSGLAKLTDFGIAKDINSQTLLTEAGTGLGTFSYMAPEQFEAARDVTAAADLYGLGATLYHLLAGRPPFVYSGRGDPAAFVDRILREDPPDLVDFHPDLPVEVVRFVGSLLQKDPARRPRSAEVVFGVLDGLVRRYAPPAEGDSSQDTLPLT